MKNISLFIITATLLLAFGGPVVHAEPVGRVLVAVGDTSALRDGAVVRLTRGAEVQTGDTLRVGEASNMQVRFTDEGITALRSNSEFRIDDYKFEEKTNIGKSFFSLVKGGMRAITGLIGRYNRDNYAVKAATATIGIRGTHFVLAQCAGDCFNKDGSQADDGLFGGVTDGRIAVTNQAGEKEFGKNEFFHVPSANALPKPLLAPPSFLRDQLEGRAKARKGKSTLAKAADGGEAENGDKDSSGEDKGGADTGEGDETAVGATEEKTNTAVATQPAGTASAPAQPVVNTQFVPADQTVVQTNVSGGLINTVLAGQSFPYQMSVVNAWAGVNHWTDAGGSGTGLFGYSDAWLEQGTLTILDPTKLLQANDVLFADFVVNQTPVKTFLMNAYSASGVWEYYYITGNCGWNCTGTLAGTASFSWAKTASTDTGASALAGNLSWGRFTSSSSETVLTGIYAGNTNSDTSYEHWAAGDVVNFAALPTTGTYSYTYVGGTRPTDQNGAMGTIISGGAVGITFNSTGANVSLTGASWNMPVTNNTYNLNFTNEPVTIAQQPYNFTTSGYADVGVTTYITPINTTALCSGACASATPISVNAVVSPMLFGAAAQGLAVGIHTSIPSPVGTSPAENTASVQAYKVSGTPPI